MKQFKWLLLPLMAGMLVAAGCHHTNRHDDTRRQHDRGGHHDDPYRRY